LLRTHKLVISMIFCLPAFAGVSPIGMATSDGDIAIGRVRMPGTATLYEGAVVETGNSPARLNLRNGTVVRLGGGAKATIHSDSLLLERGVGQIDAPGDYAIRARSVTLIPTARPARARLQLGTDGALQVAALSGSFEIRRAGAASIMSAGRSLRFAAETGEAGAAAPSQFKGCLAKADKTYLLHDDGSNAVVALEGGSVSGKSGDRVTVVGKPDAAASQVAGASQVIQVLRFTVDGHGCSAKFALTGTTAGAGSATAGSAAGGAAGAGAAGAGAAGAATAGAISGTTIAVIGVAAASAALIPTIALTSGSSSSNISPSSR
jgi:hypothetical protein